MDKRLIGFYLDAIITPLFFFLPVYTVVFLQELNFSLTQIGILFAVTPFLSLLLELPTGLIADNYGRKFSTILGYTIIGFGYLGIYFTQSFWVIFLLFVLAGLGISLVSGAQESWITSLVGLKKLARVFSNMQSFESAATLVSGFLGVFLVSMFGTKIIWIGGAMAYFLGAIFLSFSPEDFKKSKVSAKKYLADIKKAINYISTHKYLKYYYIAFFFFGFQVPFTGPLVWIPFLESLGYPSAQFGYMWSAMSFIGIFAPFIGNKVAEKTGMKRTILFFLTLWIISLLFIAVTWSLWYALLLLILTVLFDFATNPVHKSYLQHQLTEKIRATLSSVNSLVFSIGMTIGFPLAGLVADIITPQYTLVISGILLLPVAYFYTKMKEIKQ